MTIELYKGLLLVAFLAPAVWLDQRHHRIPNLLTGGLLLAGVLFQLATSGLPGAAAALAGALVGFGLLIVFYVLGGMAAGDVKLMAAVGACLGWEQALTAVCFSLLAGGGIGALVFTCQYYYTGVLTSVRFPFASAIAAGTAAALIIKELPWAV